MSPFQPGQDLRLQVHSLVEGEHAPGLLVALLSPLFRGSVGIWPHALAWNSF